MVDAEFAHPRLAAIYDALDPDRGDLLPYLAIAKDLKARRVIDIGCGTGTFAVLLAVQGLDVTAVDPALASLDVARQKPGAEAVRWIHGVATDLPPLQADLTTMTANVAMAIADPDAWTATLQAIHAALEPGGHLVVETRVPAREAWRQWTRADSHTVTDIDGVGPVESWVDVVEVNGPLVSFRWTFVFAGDGAVLTSDSTLRFRRRTEMERDLAAHGFTVEEVRDAPDRPGREMMFVAAKPVSTVAG